MVDRSYRYGPSWYPVSGQLINRRDIVTTHWAALVHLATVLQSRQHVTGEGSPGFGTPAAPVQAGIGMGGATLRRLIPSDP